MIAYQDELMDALQKDKAGDWDGAHRIVQQIESPESYWVHAYLHREEGDLSNSRYWYNRAGKPFPDISLEEEWGILHDFISSD
jgi:hypothetical protein